MLLAIFTVFRKKVDRAVFSMDSDDWNTQYEDTGNSSIEEKQPLTGIKSGRIIRNWKNTISCWMNTFYQDQEDENH